MPAPPARMRSAKIPWGTSSHSTSPRFMRAMKSGLSPMWVETSFRTMPVRRSRSTPSPGSLASFLITVSPG